MRPILPTPKPGKDPNKKENYRSISLMNMDLVLKPTQKGALQAWFQHNPYPGITTREQLAQELDIPETRIQVWLQNMCTRQLRQSRLGSAKSQGEGPPHKHQQPPEGRRKRTSISPSETSILLQAFEKKRIPTGLPESHIQVWFQNRIAQHQRRAEVAL
uniref:Homeobox domain-containing protein n=1 Tax=Ursus maritimus TaxID=29073 RepID=A0A452USX8_URSMA